MRADALTILTELAGDDRLVHVERIPGRAARHGELETPLDHDVWWSYGLPQLWAHQAEAIDHARAGRSVVVATGTASGKSVAYQLPILTALKADSRSRVLYLSPTKALGHDQLRAAVALTEAVPALHDVAPSSYDGDSPTDVRRFARERSHIAYQLATA